MRFVATPCVLLIAALAATMPQVSAASDCAEPFQKTEDALRKAKEYADKNALQSLGDALGLDAGDALDAAERALDNGNRPAW